MKTRLLSREIVTVFVLSAVAVACGSAPTEEGAESTEQGLSVPPIHLPPAVCVSHPGCSLIPFPSPKTFPVPEVPVLVRSGSTHHTTCEAEPAFTDYLTSIGCVPIGSYMPPGESPLAPWAASIGFCPPTTSTIDDGVLWETMPCDECTGTPPNALWTVVAYTNPSAQACDGDSPGPGCALGGCLPPGNKNGNL